MAVVVNTSLCLSAGKLAAQVAHAALLGSSNLFQLQPHVVDRWNSTGQKIVVLASTDLGDLHKQAQELGVPKISVNDAGRTEVAPGTRTCMAFGPGPSSQVDSVTGTLSLLKGFTPKHLIHNLARVPSIDLPAGYTVSTWDAEKGEACARAWTSILSKAGQDVRHEYILIKSREESVRIWFVTRNFEHVATCMMQHRVLSHIGVIPEAAHVDRGFLSYIVSLQREASLTPVLAEVITETAELSLRSVGFC